MMGVCISLCDLTGNILKPWADAGYVCYAVDIQHSPGLSQDGQIIKVGADVHRCITEWLPLTALARIAIAFAFPPCIHTAVSGAKYFESNGPRKAAEAFALIARCRELLEWFACPWMYEQPVATTSTYCGKPDQTFDPCDYGDPYRKKTCLWTGGKFIMPEKKPVEPIQVCKSGSWIMQLGGSSARTKNLRSATPMGFAQAVFKTNHRLTV